MHAGSPEMQLRAAEQAWAAGGVPPGRAPAGFGGGGTPDMQAAAAAAAFRARGQALDGSRSGGGGGGQAPRLTPADALRLSLGAAILGHIEADLAAAARGGGGGGGGAAAALAAIRGTSPELDSIRDGARALLEYFTDKGASCFLGLV